MRAEVGLLSRNLKFKGDDESTEANNYGAHIMLAGEGVRGKFSNIQLNNVGQAFKLGRYPIHFHMAGNVAGSYIKNNVIHSSNNRGITLHAVRKLRLESNVIYKNLGHSVFIEDGIETNNEIINNLVVDTRRTFSLLITDQTPASFWI
jgi:nitrous oxidase accessory protein NosD